MGQFVIEIGERQHVVPNMLHKEGADMLWRNAYMGEHNFTKYYIGITGWGILDDPERRPDHTSGGADFAITEDTTYADVISQEGYAFDATHMALMSASLPPPNGPQEQEVTFLFDDMGLAVSNPPAEFNNLIPWYPFKVGNCGGWLMDGLTAPAGNNKVETPVVSSYPPHDFPWATPIFWPGEWYKVGSADTFIFEPDPPDGWWGVLWPNNPAGNDLRVYLTNKTTCRTYGPYTIDHFDNTGPAIMLSALNRPGNVGSAIYASIREHDATLEAIEKNPWLGVSWPVCAAYLAGYEPNTDQKYLIATCRLNADVVLYNYSPIMRIWYASAIHEWLAAREP